jgi:hypothetical protein
MSINYNLNNKYKNINLNKGLNNLNNISINNIPKKSIFNKNTTRENIIISKIIRELSKCIIDSCYVNNLEYLKEHFNKLFKELKLHEEKKNFLENIIINVRNSYYKNQDEKNFKILNTRLIKIFSLLKINILNSGIRLNMTADLKINKLNLEPEPKPEPEPEPEPKLLINENDENKAILIKSNGSKLELEIGKHYNASIKGTKKIIVLKKK